MSKHQQTTVIWLVAGVLIGALLSGAGLGLYAYAHAPAAPSEDSAKGRITATCTNLALPQRVVLSPVADHEFGDAFTSMQLRPHELANLRDKLLREKGRLLWLTIWDWDTMSPSGDTVTITSDNYRRRITLSNHRTRIDIPEPRARYIELRGERSEDGIVAISLLSGNYPIALPHMKPGQVMKVEIDTTP